MTGAERTRAPVTFRDGHPCPACGLLHSPPACAHDYAAECRLCGGRIGWLGEGQPSDGTCWRCMLMRMRLERPQP